MPHLRPTLTMMQFKIFGLKRIGPFSILRRHFQVSVIGAAKPLGQTISFLLKQHPLVQRLHMIDDREEIKGIAIDVSHIPEQAAVLGWKDNMEEALFNSDIVIVASGEQRKSGQRDTKLFKENAETVISVMRKIGSQCPKAFVVIATEPINRIVPLASKVLQYSGFDNKNKILGITGQDTMRAQCWISEMSGLRPDLIKIPVICGHSSGTIVPIFSHIIPKIDISDSTAATVTKFLRKSEDYIADIKNSLGNYSLFSAYATSSTVSAVLNALNGVNTQHVAFVSHDIYDNHFFSTPILVTSEGVCGILQYAITSQESNLLFNATQQLAREVNEGEAYFKPSYKFSEYQKIFSNAKVYF